MKVDTAKAAVSVTHSIEKILCNTIQSVIDNMHLQNPNEQGFEDVFFHVWAQHVLYLVDFIVSQVDIMSDDMICLSQDDFDRYFHRLLDLLPDWIKSEELQSFLYDYLLHMFYERNCVFVEELVADTKDKLQNERIKNIQSLVAFQYAMV